MQSNTIRQQLSALLAVQSRHYLDIEFPRLVRYLSSPLFLSRVPSTIAVLYPVQKIFRALGKILELNLMEMEWVLWGSEREGWQVESAEICSFQQKMSWLVVLPQVRNEQHYRKLSLYLLLFGIHVKTLLHSEQLPQLLALASTYCPSFLELYSRWAPSLQLPNSCSQEFLQTPVDYNDLVDGILLISPPYRTKSRRMKQARTQVISGERSKIVVYYKERRQKLYRSQTGSQQSTKTE